MRNQSVDSFMLRVTPEGVELLREVRKGPSLPSVEDMGQYVMQQTFLRFALFAQKVFCIEYPAIFFFFSLHTFPLNVIALQGR